MKRLLPALSIWVFITMSITLLLRMVCTFLSLPQPPQLNLLVALVYLAGSIVGGSWGISSLRRKKLALKQLVLVAGALAVCVFFFLLGVLFGLRGV